MADRRGSLQCPNSWFRIQCRSRAVIIVRGSSDRLNELSENVSQAAQQHLKQNHTTPTQIPPFKLSERCKNGCKTLGPLLCSNFSFLINIILVLFKICSIFAHSIIAFTQHSCSCWERILLGVLYYTSTEWCMNASRLNYKGYFSVCLLYWRLSNCFRLQKKNMRHVTKQYSLERLVVSGGGGSHLHAFWML